MPIPKCPVERGRSQYGQVEISVAVKGRIRNPPLHVFQRQERRVYRANELVETMHGQSHMCDIVAGFENIQYRIRGPVFFQWHPHVLDKRYCVNIGVEWHLWRVSQIFSEVGAVVLCYECTKQMRQRDLTGP